MQITNHEWSKESLFSKAQLYAETMEEHDGTNWQYGLWSAFVLEMLIRAAVANTSPALIADSQDWNNILYGLGFAPKKQKYVPKSASITDIVSRTEELCPDFTREHANFCAAHFARRNSEIHTGNLPFENLGSSNWLPLFYSVCEVLTLVIGESLESLFGSETASRARNDISALKDETAKTAKGTVNAHKTIWELKTDAEKETLKRQAETASLRHYGHRVPCPSCSCIALLQGEASGAAKQIVDQDGIVERQVMKPEAIHCIACGLKISGYSKLLAVGLGDTFISTSHYDAMEYFQIDLDAHVRGMMEDDNNEY